MEEIRDHVSIKSSREEDISYQQEWTYYWALFYSYIGKSLLDHFVCIIVCVSDVCKQIVLFKVSYNSILYAL